MIRGYLADTHVLLWSWHSRPELLPHHVEILTSNAPIHVSVATIWEISIKAALGKLKTVDHVADRIVESGFTILPIEPRHAEFVRQLPHHHRDPFDRMLVAQAISEGYALMTADRAFNAYDVEIA